MQQPEGVPVAEVFELNAGFRKDLLNAGDKLVHQFVVLLAAQTPLRQPYVERILEQGLVVRADIQRDRQTLRGTDGCAYGVQRELSHRDAHAVRAEVAEAEDPFAVGDDDHADIAVRPIPQKVPDATAIFVRNIQPARAAENVSELLTSLAYRRSVDEGHHLLDVFHDHAVEQVLVAFLQRDQENVLLDVAGLAANVFQYTRHLYLLRGHAWRQEGAQAQAVALRLCKGRALVQHPVARQ